MVRKAQRESRSGVTLMEVIITLVLVGIIAVFAAAAMLSAVRGFVLARDNAETAQKVHLAMNRMSRDLLVVTNIVSGTGQAVVFDTILPTGGAVRETLAFANGIVTLDATPLLDGVTGFEIRYIRYNMSGSEVAEDFYSPNVSRGVEIRLQRGQGSEYTNSVQYVDCVFPRNLAVNLGMMTR